VVAVLAYLQLGRAPSRTLIVATGAVLLLFLGFVDALRGTAASALAGELANGGWSRQVTEGVWMVASSNEAFASHFSLYGVLSHDLPTEWGWGVMSLVASVVPRFAWPTRPLDIYQTYVDGVGAVQDQGYTIHHAAGWTLTFGPIGIALGAAVLGLVWVAAYRAQDLALAGKLRQLRLFMILLPALLVANFPMFVRGGIEAYKGLMIDAVLAPLLLLTLVQKSVNSATEGLTNSRKSD
jgi:hypothetical protein